MLDARSVASSFFVGEERAPRELRPLFGELLSDEEVEGDGLGFDRGPHTSTPPNGASAGANG